MVLSPAQEPGGPRVPWSRKTREQRIEHMGLVVFPEMRALFEAHDPERYRQFRCQTCHGEDMVARRYAMPGPLPALPAANPVATAASHDDRATRFMVGEVVPVFRRLMDADNAAPAESACATCHPVE